MLSHHHRPICLSLTSTDLPVWSEVQTTATLYEKGPEQFHLLLTEPQVNDFASELDCTHPRSGDTALAPQTNRSPVITPRLLWIEISPSRLVMTMQGNGQFSYRHFWERGVYGLSRYWLQTNPLGQNNQLQLRNFTRYLRVDGRPLPRFLQLDYELWTGNLQMGCYVLQIEIDP
jgi:hypothetical protein